MPSCASDHGKREAGGWKLDAFPASGFQLLASSLPIASSGSWSVVYGLWSVDDLMNVLVGSLLMHVVLAQVVPSPWWVPDVALAGCVLVVSAAPKRWAPLSAVPAVAMMPWLTRATLPLGLGYLMCGAMVRLAATRWDVADARVQLTLVVVASTFMTLGAMALAGLCSLPVVGLAVLHVGLTALCVPLIRYFSRAGAVSSKQ